MSHQVDRVGQQVGNYRLEQLLGRGGFAEVYLGRHVYLDSPAAIKLLHTNLAQGDIEGFRSEAITLVRLIHPNIVRILDFGYRPMSQPTRVLLPLSTCWLASMTLRANMSRLPAITRAPWLSSSRH